MDRIWKMLVLIFSLVIVDQMTKAAVQSSFYLGESLPVIPNLFNLTYVRNTGAAFGFLAGAPEYIRVPLFLLLPVVACGWFACLIWQVRHKSLLLTLAYSLILAGAIGNLWDRFALGYVVDFFDFYWGRSHFPAFNIADSCISVAAGLLIYDFFINGKKNKNKKKNKAAA